MTVLYTIDSTLVDLGAFAFSPGGGLISGIPIPYWAGSFAGGILFGYFIPGQPQWKPVYILAAAFLFLAAELIMVRLGTFHHINWNPFKSFLLNVFGFTITLWWAEWLGVIEKNQEALNK